MEEIGITIAVILIASWVVADALKHKMGSAESDTPTPFKIGFGCLLFCPICVPYYLIKRSKFIEKASKNPSESAPRKSEKIVFALLSLTFLYLTVNNASSSSNQLPSCESSEVKDLVQEIANENYGEGYVFSNFGQVKYDSDSGMRVCRTSWSGSGNSGILGYTVEWYSDKKEQFYVQFQ